MVNISTITQSPDTQRAWKSPPATGWFILLPQWLIYSDLCFWARVFESLGSWSASSDLELWFAWFCCTSLVSCVQEFIMCPSWYCSCTSRRWETGGSEERSGLACGVVPSGSCPLWSPKLFWSVGSVTSFWMSTRFPFGLNFSKPVSLTCSPQNFDPGTYTPSETSQSHTPSTGAVPSLWAVPSSGSDQEGNCMQVRFRIHGIWTCLSFLLI